MRGRPPGYPSSRRLRTPQEFALCLRIAGAVPMLWLAVRLLPLPRALAWITPRRMRNAECGVRNGDRLDGASTVGPSVRPVFRIPHSAFRIPQSVAPDRVVDLADRVLARRPFGLRSTCLLRSLVLYRFLRERDVPVRIHIGVARRGASLAGHAWLTLDGRPFHEPGDPTQEFRTVLSYPSG